MKKILIIVCASIILNFQFSTLNSLQAQVFVGLNAGLNFEGNNDKSSGIGLSFGVDVGFLMTPHSVWGLYYQEHGNTIGGHCTHRMVGLMHLPREWKGQTSFFWGAGIDLRRAGDTRYGNESSKTATTWTTSQKMDENGLGIALRAGLAFKSHLYISADLSVGGYKARNDIYSLHREPAGWQYDGYSAEHEDLLYYNLGINLGYRF